MRSRPSIRRPGATRSGRLATAAGLVLASIAVPWPPSVDVALAGPQEHEHRHASPYADQEDSGIAALSLQELRDLESGAGMGLARAAELNHFPGPKHVLELADDLELSPEQRLRVREIFERMQAQARDLGAEIIERERLLDRRFAHGHVDADVVGKLTESIGRLQGRLRAVHLVAHLETRALLEPGQVAAYDRARGYESAEQN